MAGNSFPTQVWEYPLAREGGLLAAGLCDTMHACRQSNEPAAICPTFAIQGSILQQGTGVAKADRREGSHLLALLVGACRLAFAARALSLSRQDGRHAIRLFFLVLVRRSAALAALPRPSPCLAVIFCLGITGLVPCPGFPPLGRGEDRGFPLISRVIVLVLRLGPSLPGLPSFTLRLHVHLDLRRACARLVVVVAILLLLEALTLAFRLP